MGGILLRHVEKLPEFLRGLGAERRGRGMVLQPKKSWWSRHKVMVAEISQEVPWLDY